MTRWHARWLLLCCLQGWFALAGPGAARSQDPDDVPVRRVGVAWERGAPALSVSVRDLATEAVRRRLAAGLPQTLTFRVFTYEDLDADPIAVAARSCRVVFDLWEERYRVDVTDHAGDGRASFEDVDAVLNRCLVARQMPVATAEAIGQARRISFAVVVELNPMSQEAVRKIRRWLSRSSDAGDGAFFGSFVSLFVNQEFGEAERRVRFRSQWVSVPE